MILIIDKSLSSSQVKLLNQHLSVYTVDVKDDNEKKIKHLPVVDLYIVDITRTKCFGRSYGLRFLETNSDSKMERIYYRRTSIIKKKNLPRMNAKIIKSLPTTADNKQDLLDRLNINSLPHTQGGAMFCLKWIIQRVFKSQYSSCLLAFFSCT